MKKTRARKIIAAVALFAMAASTTMAGAATKGRIIPSDTVTFHKDGKILAEFKGQAPVNDSALTTCNKACSVRLNGMSLSVADETTFAVREGGQVMNLYVKEGLVTFTISKPTQQISFYTPDGRYVKTEGFITPASTENRVKGYMIVDGSSAQIGINQGGMILLTANGVQTIDQGYTYTLNLNELPATGVGAEVPVEGTTAAQGYALGFGVVGVGTAGALIWQNNNNNNNSGSPGSPNQ